MKKWRFDEVGGVPKVKQITGSIIMGIEKGTFARNERLLSINEFSSRYSVARDTVEKAYNRLKKEGYIVSARGKGYYVVGKKEKKVRILLLFNKISAYKKNVYDAFISKLGNHAKVDLHIHHYNVHLFKEIIEDNIGKYHYYVIMPHFLSGADKKSYLGVLKKINPDALLLLDKNLPELGKTHMSVFQDFKKDIYDALSSAVDLLEKYNKLVISIPGLSNHPVEIVDGAAQFCKEHKKQIKVIDNIEKEEILDKTVYIVTTEDDLATLVKKIRKSGLVLGKDVGIISFNETVLKELLDITVITTDFEEMGRTAAELILGKKYVQVKNPFQMIRRSSL
jgi:DNA-binding transcriptional regulator YhcF (GntR family)